MTESSASRADTVRGIVYMVLVMLLLTVSDSIAKHLTGTYPVAEIVCLRSVFMLMPVAFFILRGGGLDSIRMASPRAHALRACFYICSSFLIVLSVKLLPLATFVAMLFAAPLFVAALAPVILRERVGPHRWAGVLIGFAGVLVMTRPGLDAVQIGMLTGLGAALFVALRDLVTRQMRHTETANSIMLSSTGAVIVVAGLAAIPDWVPMPPGDLALMACSGTLIGVGHYLLIEALRLAEAAVVSPFKYSSMLWGAALGYFIFGEVPEPFVLAGAALVVGGGLYLLHYETRAK